MRSASGTVLPTCAPFFNPREMGLNAAMLDLVSSKMVDAWASRSWSTFPISQPT
jgi:hypothetical protein